MIKKQTDEFKSETELLAQLNAISLHIDSFYNLISFTGDIDFLKIDDVLLSKNIFEFLPEDLARNILNTIIQKTVVLNNTQVYVDFVKKDGKQIKLRIISSLIPNLETTEYRIIILPLEFVQEPQEKHTELKLYAEACRQLAISEARFNAYFENDPVMHINVSATTGCIINCNNFTVKKLEYNSKKELIGKPVYEIYSKEKKERSLILLDKFKKEGFLYSEEIELLTKTKKHIPVILYTTAEYNEKGEILFSRSTLVDISELKNSQKELNIKKAKLELLNAELENFVSTCSHDLQEPLATIKFSANLLDQSYKGKLDSKGKDYISYIDEAVDRLSVQIRSLLDHVLIGKNAERSNVNTHKLIGTVVKDLRKKITQYNAQIIFNSSLPNIQAYEVELRLLFQNLISNAIKYSKSEVNPIITIDSEETNEYIHFSINDNGIGIAELDFKEIFKIFNRVNNENPNKGAGVGLAHCDKIVRMHEGDIKVTSTLGKGSTFKFKLKKNYVL